MEEKYEIIKAKKENAFQRIKDAEQVLKEIRETCDHPEELYEKVTYSTRPGQYWENTTICSVCGEVIKWPYEGMDIDLTFTADKND